MAMHNGVTLGILVRSEHSKELMLMSPRLLRQPVAVDVSPSCLNDRRMKRSARSFVSIQLRIEGQVQARTSGGNMGELERRIASMTTCRPVIVISLSTVNS